LTQTAALDLIERIGAYVGLAAFVGLAILALLYFSQARDVRRLREWAGRAPERAERPAAGQHYLPPTTIEQAARKPRRPLRERLRRIYVPQLRYTALAIGGVIILAGAVFGAFQLASDDGGGATNGSLTQRQRTDRDSGGNNANNPVRVDPSQVTVAVLNGTTIAGLAAQVGEEARADGFTLGTVTNAAKTNQSRSQVLYRKGQKAAADGVSRRLGIPSTAQVDPLSAELAGSFDVVVLVGTDRSQ
jgi:LytR cell envelope-related transcriptional attenuator